MESTTSFQQEKEKDAQVYERYAGQEQNILREGQNIITKKVLLRLFWKRNGMDIRDSKRRVICYNSDRSRFIRFLLVTKIGSK